MNETIDKVLGLGYSSTMEIIYNIMIVALASALFLVLLAVLVWVDAKRKHVEALTKTVELHNEGQQTL